MNQTGFRFPDNPNDPTGRHCSHPARKYAWICRERAPAINIGEIEERKGHSARLIIFSIAEEERFSRGRLAEVSAVVKNRRVGVLIPFCFPSKLYICKKETKQFIMARFNFGFKDFEDWVSYLFVQIFNLNTDWRAIHTWNKKRRNLLIILIHLKSHFYSINNTIMNK